MDTSETTTPGSDGLPGLIVHRDNRMLAFEKAPDSMKPPQSFREKKLNGKEIVAKEFEQI